MASATVIVQEEVIPRSFQTASDKPVLGFFNYTILALENRVNYLQNNNKFGQLKKKIYQQTITSDFTYICFKAQYK